jgi:hypothetical protein
MCKKGFWVKPAFLLPVLLAVALLAGCKNPTEPEPTLTTPVVTTATPGYKTISVIWEAVTGATEYEVYYSEDSTPPNSDTAGSTEGVNISGTTVTISGLTNGTVYYVWVRAKNDIGMTSDYIAAGSGALTPSTQAPATLIVAGIDAKLVVSWTAIPGATGYEILSDTGETVPSTGTTVTTLFAEVTGTNNTPLNVWVKALYEEDKSVKSEPSPMATGTPKALTVPFENGYYKSSWGDGFEIKAGTFYMYDDAKGGISYAGTIVANVQSTDDTGVLIIQITDSGTWFKTQSAYYGLGYDTSTPGMVKESGATHPLDYTLPINNGVSTLAEAVSTYTEANGYFGYYGTYDFQEGSVINMEKFEGTWGNENYDLECLYVVEITDSLYSVSMDTDADGSLETTYFSGTILETTDSDATTGTIYLRLIEAETIGGATGNYFAVTWEWSGTTLKLADAAAVSTVNDLVSAKQYLTSFDTALEFEKQPLLDVGDLEGSWINDYDDVVAITGSTFTYYLSGYGSYIYFAGFIKEITDSTADSGYIYIKFTDVYTDSGDYEDCTVGHYYAIRWDNKTESGVDLGFAYKYDGEDDMDTLEGAKTEFTVANGYFESAVWEEFVPYEE